MAAVTGLSKNTTNVGGSPRPIKKLEVKPDAGTLQALRVIMDELQEENVSQIVRMAIKRWARQITASK
jgi:hypothetical protein